MADQEAKAAGIVSRFFSGMKSLFMRMLGKVENSTTFRRWESEQVTIKPHSKLWFAGKALMLLGAFILVGIVVHEMDRGNPRVSRITSLVSPYVTIGDTAVVSRATFNEVHARMATCEQDLTNLMKPPADEFSTTVNMPNSDPATFEAEHPRPAPSTQLAPLNLPAAKLPKLPAKAAAPSAKKNVATKCIGWCSIGKMVGAN